MNRGQVGYPSHFLQPEELQRLQALKQCQPRATSNLLCASSNKSRLGPSTLPTVTALSIPNCVISSTLVVIDRDALDQPSGMSSQDASLTALKPALAASSALAANPAGVRGSAERLMFA